MLGRKLAGWCALFALSALGCGTGTDGPRGGEVEVNTDAAKPLPECPYSEVKPCDIRMSDCQDFLLGVAACMRGREPPKSLTIDLLTEDEYVELLRQDYADTKQNNDVHFGQALAPLGLARASNFILVGDTLEATVQAQTKSLAGEYRPKEKRVVIIDRGQADDSIRNNVVLVHELVHALQDVDVDLANWPHEPPSTTLDSVMALTSVYEGEAEFYARRAEIALDGDDVRKVAFRTWALEAARNAAQGAAENDQPYRMSRSLFPYTFGAIQAYDAWHAEGPAGIDPLYDSPPTTTQSIIARALAEDEPEDLIASLPGPALDALNLVDEDVLGAWGLLLVLSRQKLDFTTAGILASAWRNDHLWVFTDSTDFPTYALWEVELGDEKAASDLNDALELASQQASRAFTHGVMGTRVFVSAGYADPPDDAVTTAGQAWLSGN